MIYRQCFGKSLFLSHAFAEAERGILIWVCPSVRLSVCPSVTLWFPCNNSSNYCSITFKICIQAQLVNHQIKFEDHPNPCISFAYLRISGILIGHWFPCNNFCNYCLISFKFCIQAQLVNHQIKFEDQPDPCMSFAYLRISMILIGWLFRAITSANMD